MAYCLLSRGPVTGPVSPVSLAFGPCVLASPVGVAVGNLPGGDAYTPGLPSQAIGLLGPFGAVKGTTGNTSWGVNAAFPAFQASAFFGLKTNAIGASLPAFSAGVAWRRGGVWAVGAVFPAFTAATSWKRGGSWASSAVFAGWSVSASWKRGGSWGAVAAFPAFAATMQRSTGKAWPVHAAFPGWLASMAWVSSKPWEVGAEFPAFTASLRLGDALTAEFPAFSASVGWKRGNVWRVDARFPAFSAQASVVLPKAWRVNAALPAFAASVRHPAPMAPASVAAQFPAFSASASWRQGGRWAVGASFPAFTAQVARSWGNAWRVAAAFSGWSAALSSARVGGASSVYCLYTETFAVSMFEGYPFMVLGDADGTPFGATADGVYLLRGEDDAGQPIDCHLLSGQSDFDSVTQKRVPMIHADWDGNAAVLVEADGQRREFPLKRRALVSQGWVGNRWAFGIRNVDGSRITLRTLQPQVEVLARRMPVPGKPRSGGRWAIRAGFPVFSSSVGFGL